MPAGTRRIRLVTNLQIYWDQVLIDNRRRMPRRAQRGPAASATLHFRGYPKQIEGASPGDLNYDYNRVSLTGPFQRERGSYTRMGDVTPLLKGMDNRFVIFGSGEEIAAEFDALHCPLCPRTGSATTSSTPTDIVKDMDWWDASPFTVSQLPFHGMSAYPYPASEKMPDDAAWWTTS